MFLVQLGYDSSQGIWAETVWYVRQRRQTWWRWWRRRPELLLSSNTALESRTGPIRILDDSWFRARSLESESLFQQFFIRVNHCCSEKWLSLWQFCCEMVVSFIWLCISSRERQVSNFQSFLARQALKTSQDYKKYDKVHEYILPKTKGTIHNLLLLLNPLFWIWASES